VKFLIDNQLPAALARWLARRGHDAVHVFELGVEIASDRSLWEYAFAEERIAISKDEDFFILANRPGDTGRLLWVRIGNCRTRALLSRLEAAWPEIEQSFADGERIVTLL
jgi:predicted nuclease of predicted toxin-antitoxin system